MLSCRSPLVISFTRGSVCVPSHVQLLVTLWTVAHQASLSVDLSSQEYWRGLPFPTPGDLLNPGIEPTSLASPALEADSLLLRLLGSPAAYASLS